MAKKSGHREDDRALRAGALLLIALHVAGAVLAPRFLWGVHHLRYLPAAWIAVTAAAAVLLALPAGARAVAAAAGRWRAFADRRPASGRLVAAIAAAALFFLFRYHNLFLGDGFMVEEIVAKPDEWAVGRAGFGSLLVYTGLLRLARLALPDAGGALPFAVLNPLAGAAWLLLTAALAREIAGAGRNGAALFVALASTAVILLFCGYVEDYALMHVALAGAILLTLRWLDGRAPLAAPLAAAALACLLHLSAVALLPAWLAVLVVRIRSVRYRALAVAAVGAAATCGFALLLNYMHPEYHGVGALLPLSDSGYHAFTLFSPPHLHFLMNEILLVLGGALLLPLLAGAGTGRAGGGKRKGQQRRGDRERTIFLGALSALGLLYFVLIDPRLGSRDWDLMSLPAVPWICLAGHLALRGRREVGRRAVAFFGAACLFHTLPWIVVNADRDRAVAMTLDMVSRDGHYAEAGAWANRAFGYLLMQQGYTEQSVEVAERSVRVTGDALDLYNAGIAAFERGDGEGAVTWFRRAIAARPGYEAAYRNLGKAYLRLGEPAQVEEALRRRFELGEDAQSRYLLGLALGQLGRTEESIAALERSLDLDSTNAEAWGTVGVGYASTGRTDEARTALERSLEIDPDNARVREFLATLPAEGEGAGTRSKAESGATPH